MPVLVVVEEVGRLFDVLPKVTYAADTIMTAAMETRKTAVGASPALAHLVLNLVPLANLRLFVSISCQIRSAE